MFNRTAATAFMAIALAATLSAQAAKPAGAKGVTHDITITAEEVYTGTMEMVIDAGKVTGKMLLTSPTPITGDVMGTSKAGALALEFGFHMVEQNCDGTVKMDIQLPETPGVAKGTMEAVGCGRDATNKVIGTVELKPAEPKTPKH